MSPLPWSTNESALDGDVRLYEVVGGWHCGSRRLNLTVRGATPADARRLYGEAVEKAAELRARPEPFARADDALPSAPKSDGSDSGSRGGGLGE